MSAEEEKNISEPEFEEVLRGFEPQRPRALPPGVVPSDAWRRLAAAAVVLVAIGGSMWMVVRATRTTTARRPIAMKSDDRNHAPAGRLVSSTQLTRAALENEQQFNALMDELAARTLPCCEGPTSSLAALAK